MKSKLILDQLVQLGPILVDQDQLIQAERQHLHLKVDNLSMCQNLCSDTISTYSGSVPISMFLPRPRVSFLVCFRRSLPDFPRCTCPAPTRLLFGLRTFMFPPRPVT